MGKGLFTEEGRRNYNSVSSPSVSTKIKGIFKLSRGAPENADFK